MRLLLHTCCGPCFLGVWEDLESSDFEVLNYFYNPNIWPEEEYQKRLNNLKIVAKQSQTKVIEGEYETEEYRRAVAGKEDQFPLRCLDCYRLRLEKTAQKAKKEKIPYFSTTLLVSPYQNQEALLQIGNELAQKYELNFLNKDWRPFFRAGQNEAKNLEIYRQKYCGCKYSIE